MKKRDYTDFIQDVIESVKDIGTFTNDITFEDFIKDRKTINAVIRSLEVIGEATKKIPYSIRNKYPAIPWKKMAGMRDKLIHEYFGIDLEILWKVARVEIPPLKDLFDDVLKDLI